MSALLLDMDGVLYQGEKALPGAREAVAWLKRERIPHLFLTNTTSRPRSALVAKLAGMGIEVSEEAILTPPVAARSWLKANTHGPVALFVAEGTMVEFEGLEIGGGDEAAAVVVGDLGEAWTFDTYNRIFRLLMQEPRPALIALGLTRYWRGESGLRLDVGPFIKGLEYAAGCEAVVTGKPATPFFNAALALLGVNAGQAFMIGDDIKGDIDAAQQAGIRGLLVRSGKFRSADLDLGIHPHAILDSIADLPRWWEKRVGVTP